jgi:hypothetical protein
LQSPLVLLAAARQAAKIVGRPPTAREGRKMRRGTEVPPSRLETIEPYQLYCEVTPYVCCVVVCVTTTDELV